MTLTPVSTQQPLRRAESTAEGDKAAARGDWPKAIELWRLSLESDERDVAAERIRWFLDERAQGEENQAKFRDRGKNVRLLPAIALASGVLATAMVLIAQGRSGIAAPVLASSAWLFYVASATLTVVYAYRTGRPTGHRPLALTSGDIARAAFLAEELGEARSDGPSAA